MEETAIASFTFAKERTSSACRRKDLAVATIGCIAIQITLTVTRPELTSHYKQSFFEGGALFGSPWRRFESDHHTKRDPILLEGVDVANNRAVAGSGHKNHEKSQKGALDSCGSLCFSWRSIATATGSPCEATAGERR